jgi:cellulose synthase/poly-beta-1,6-N-acetylglucosamine synthase-like glycosyltransferase
VSLIVPAHNEEDVIERTIQAFLNTTYPENKKEAIIINDGSQDKTEDCVRKYAYKVITDGKEEVNPNSLHKNIILVNRKEGGHGKSFALNSGKAYAKGEVLFFIDADVQICTDVLEKAVRHLAEKDVSAVAGYVEVSKKKRSLLNQMIDFEYVIGQKILRCGYNVLGVHYIVPGGCAFFKKETLDQVGDYHNDTLAEDTDITWRVITEAKGKIHFDKSIKVIADEPATLLSLWNQRVRWARGNIEVTLKNKNKVLKPKYGRALSWVYPFWLSPLILPFAFTLSAVALVLAFIFGIPLYIPYIGEVIAIAFISTILAGVIINQGRGWLAGLLSPGIPLFTLIPILVATDLKLDFGLMQASFINVNVMTVLQFIYSIWILLAIPATYLCIGLAKKYPKLANTIQIYIIGYWMFLLITTLEGFRREAFNAKREWVRTQR